MAVFKLPFLRAVTGKDKRLFLNSLLSPEQPCLFAQQNIGHMSPQDLIFYFGEYRGAKWEHLCGAEYERLVRLVALGVLAFGVSKEHFFKLLEKDITETINYLNSVNLDGIDIQVGTIKEPEFVQGDLPL